MTSFNDGIEAAAQELRRVAELHEQSCCGLWSRAAQQRALLKRDVLQEMSNRVRALKRPEPSEATQAAADVLAERRRQIEAEGWTPEHDDQWVHGELALAAAGYAEAGGNVHRDIIADLQPSLPFTWAWSPLWWKPTDRRRDLVKAGALILAEIERIDRAALKAMEQQGKEA